MIEGNVQCFRIVLNNIVNTDIKLLLIFLYASAGSLSTPGALFAFSCVIVCMTSSLQHHQPSCC